MKKYRVLLSYTVPRDVFVTIEAENAKRAKEIALENDENQMYDNLYETNYEICSEVSVLDITEVKE